VGKIALSTIDALFGLESKDGDSNHVRGALSFWDAIPQIPGDSLAVDIMTPHQSHYYQQRTDPKSGGGGSTSPHDSGSPTPISFLTLPPGTGFAFHVVCDVARLEHPDHGLAPDLAHNQRWQTLLKAAFDHAFEWLGFGAKTAVGYGAMESGEQRQRKQAEATRRQAAAKEQEKAQALQRQQSSAVAWEGARIKFNRGNGSLSVEKGGQTATAIAPTGEALLQSLPADVQQKIKTNQFVKVTAHVAEGVLVRVSVA
jgi:CRISPR-associated protein Cmr6